MIKPWNRTIKVGDYVLSKYSRDNFLYRVTDIQRRFIVAEDLIYELYSGCAIGDERSPLVTIQRAFDLSVDYKTSKKMLMKKTLDIHHLVPFEEKMLVEHINRLTDALNAIIQNNP